MSDAFILSDAFVWLKISTRRKIERDSWNFCLLRDDCLWIAGRNWISKDRKFVTNSYESRIHMSDAFIWLDAFIWVIRSTREQFERDSWNFCLSRDCLSIAGRNWISRDRKFVTNSYECRVQVSDAFIWVTHTCSQMREIFTSEIFSRGPRHLRQFVAHMRSVLQQFFAVHMWMSEASHIWMRHLTHMQKTDARTQTRCESMNEI